LYLLCFYCFVYVWLFFLCISLILWVMYFYRYVYVFLLLCMFCSVYSVFIVPTGTLRIPWLVLFCAFFSVVRKMPGYNSQRWGMVCTLPKLIVFFCLLFMCKCVLLYCHRMSTHLQLTNLSISDFVSRDLLPFLTRWWNSNNINLLCHQVE
jgi:hypothetical protein